MHQLRKSGDSAKRDPVNALLESGEAAWCPAVRLELWRGVTNDAERNTLRHYEALLPDYKISPDVWNRSSQLADRGRALGASIPLADLFIFVCAKIHGLDVAVRRRTFRRVSETRGVMALTVPIPLALGRFKQPPQGAGKTSCSQRCANSA